MKVVGVTSCIAGLAHTPMAAKALETAGKKLGYDVQIEQQGMMGIVDKLSADAIAKADLVLLACDKAIEGEDRFKGKKIVRVPIGKCITESEEILKKIEKALNK